MSSGKGESATSFRMLLVGIVLVLGVLCAAVIMVRRRQEAGLARADHDAMLVSMINMATRAQAYYRAATGLGGGGRSFRGLNDTHRLATYPDDGTGDYSITGATDSTLTLRGTGSRRGRTDSLIQITLVVRPDTFEVLSDNVPTADPFSPDPGVESAVAFNRISLDEAFRDNYQHVLQDLMKLGDRAQRYYQESARSRNEVRSFRTLDALTKLMQPETNENGLYRVLAADDTSVVLQGTGVERTRGGTRVTVRVNVRPNRIDVLPDSGIPPPAGKPAPGAGGRPHRNSN